MNKGRNLTSSKFEEHENGHDIISNLPEHILHHIFSFLDMKHAIQTCILSKRWRYFWVSLRTLNFYYKQGVDHITPTRKNEFMAFVDRVLMFRDNSNIHEFALVIPTEYYNNYIDITRLKTWILASIVRNVQQLSLDIPFPEEFHLYHCLFTCKSLTKLVVKAHYNDVHLSLPDSVTLHRLKTLCLELIEVKDENLTDRLLSNCPVLESLCIKKCKFPHDNINISSPQLQHLVLEDCSTRTHELEDLEQEIDEVDTKFKLWAPSLISFHCNSDMMSYHRRDMSDSEQCMVNILRELHNVEDLTLVASFLMVVTGAPDLLDSQPMKFCNLRSLKLTSSCSPTSVVDFMHAISYLLKISPNIETLSVEGGCDGRGYPETGLLDLLDMQPSQFCNLRCLKLRAMLSIDCTHMMAYFLKISPEIETISFTIDQNRLSGYEWYPYFDEMISDSEGDCSEEEYSEGDYWKAGMTLKCLLNHLKCFELRGVTGTINELEFIEILLNHAMLLEKLLIVFERISKCYIKEAVLTERRLVKFREKVLTFPRASSNVVIMFKYDE